jgi:hypothetical protein
MNTKAKSQLEQSMQEEQIRTAPNAHGHSSAIGDANAEHDIYDDAIPYYPQSGERINLQALRSHQPDKLVRVKEQVNVELLAFFSVQAATPEVVPKQGEWSTGQEYTVVR